MADFSKQVLSGSTDGRLILIAATATLGTAIHTVGATALDEIWLWAVNAAGATQKLTIEFGGVTDPGDLIEFTVKPEDGLYQIVPGLILTNSLVVTAFCQTTNLVSVGGYVNRIT